MKRIIITGGAGFIGSTLVDKLLSFEDFDISVIDNFDEFYSREIKQKNIQHNFSNPNYNFIECDIRDLDTLKYSLTGKYDYIVHLAAKAGVRPSILNPNEYQQVNVQGTQNLLEISRILEIPHFVFGSSSSVYGINPNVPWSESDFVLKPISPYAATKVAGELLGHVYCELYKIRFIALRFFTVFGPRQRPDLAIHKFFKLIQEGKPIPMYGDGNTLRDYTFVDDIVQGITSALYYDKSDYEIINLGNNQTVSLIELIKSIEEVIGKKATIEYLSMQAGDVPQTFANISKAGKLLDYSPKTKLIEGLDKFFNWMKRV